MLVKDLLNQISSLYPAIYDTLTLGELTQFAALASEVIKRTDGAFRLTSKKCPLEFICLSLKSPQPPATWAQLWCLAFDALPTCLHNPHSFRENGMPYVYWRQEGLIIPEHTLRPPTTQCFKCLNVLMNRPAVLGYLMDVGGIETVQYISRYCRGCNISYTPCYMRYDGIREYYTKEEGQPEQYYQVTQHYFMTHALANYFNHMQSLGVVSVSNLVLTYNQAHAAVKTKYPNDYQRSRFTRKLSPNVCSLALDIHRLMRVTNQRGIRLKSDATGCDDRRFHSAMKQHTLWLKLEGSHHSAHVCSICTTVTPIPDSNEATIFRACVTDGITIGHWACSASEVQLKALNPNSTETHCEQHLDMVTHRYCPAHMAQLKDICPAQPCIMPVAKGHHTCGNPEHVRAYREFKDKGSSVFGLPRRFTRPNSKLLMDPSEVLSTETGEVALTEKDLLFSEVEERGHESARDGGESCKHKKILLSRVRTHNEQLMVCTCGFIVGRKTFYRSESVVKVKEFIEEIFPNEKPQVIFYDNACGLYAHIRTSDTDRESFKNTLLPVDAFHMKSHKESHTTCRINNDPNKFPELKKPGGKGWRYNASAAEIVNACFGRFDSMCRGMHPVKYNFFLDEMIHLHNCRLWETICARGSAEFIGNIEYKTCPL